MFRPFLPCGIAYGSAYGIPCSFSGGRHPAGLFVLYHIGAVLVNRFRQNFGGICLFPAPGGGAPVSGGIAPALQAPCEGRALFVACLPCLWFLILPPIPPAPFPGGEGGDQGYFHARGFAPCIPGAGWDTALALLVENRFLRLQMERWHPPGGREPGLQKAATAVHLYGRVYKCRKRFSAGVPGRSPRRNKL